MKHINIIIQNIYLSAYFSLTDLSVTNKHVLKYPSLFIYLFVPVILTVFSHMC